MYVLAAVYFLYSYTVQQVIQKIVSATKVYGDLSLFTASQYKENLSTVHLQRRFDKALSKIENAIATTSLGIETIISHLCKDATMSEGFKNDLIQAESLDQVFIWIRVYSTWYQSNLLKLFSTLLDDMEINQLVDRYEKDLKVYLDERTNYYSASKGEVIILTEIDSAWDTEVLHGEHCVWSCKQIAGVLEKSGRVSGFLHNRLLCIIVSS